MTPDDLQATRLRLGFTEAQLGAALGVDRTTVIRWERGERALPPYLWRAVEHLEAERAEK